MIKKYHKDLRIKLFRLISILLLSSCGGSTESESTEDIQALFSVNGRVTNNFGNGIEGVEITYGSSKSVFTDSNGEFFISGLSGQNTITSMISSYTFGPNSFQVQSSSQSLLFVGNRIPSDTDTQIFNWFYNQQLSNGLMESAEDSNFVSLYDNALAAMVFMLLDDFAKAENIFDFFNARIATEFTSNVGGFSQIRTRNGTPNNHRWMGDNAWLLIALNNYKVRTGNTRYDNLASELSKWLVSLQDDDGGLFAGYDANNNLLNYKVTEGNIDAFNAIQGYTTVHQKMLTFLENERWNATEQSLVAWPENPTYLFALDIHPWSYSLFTNFPEETLLSAKRFLTTQTASNGMQITGYCFDEDTDTIWPEGTGQMALAFGLANMQSEKQFYLTEIEQILIQSSKYIDSAGFPYASNPGTVYGSDPLWNGADTRIALSGGAWYLFAQYNFNPFATERDKAMPEEDMFWLN